MKLGDRETLYVQNIVSQTPTELHNGKENFYERKKTGIQPVFAA